MKSREWIYIIALIVVCYFLYDAKCTSKHETISVPVPEKTGTFEAVKPVQTPIINRVIEWRDNPTKAHADRNDVAHAEQNDSINARLLSENEILRQNFKTASDSLKLAKFDKAITLNDFSNTFEDSVIKIDMSGKVRGEVQSIGVPKYTIKKSEVKTSLKTWRILASGEIGASTTLKNGAADGGLIYQSANGKQYSVKYGKIDRDDYVLIGTAITIFKHTKTK